jgi:hypothetical protein
MFKTSTGLTGTVTVMDAVITVEHCLRSYGNVVAEEHQPLGTRRPVRRGRRPSDG